MIVPTLAAAEATLPEKPVKLAYIDALRGWAILGVVLVHTLYYGAGAAGLGPLFVSFCQAGARGVQLFFMVSAFTLFLSMDNRHKREKRPTLNFFIRRFFRIAPLFYLGLGYYLLTYSRGQASVLNLLLTVLFVNGASPYYINSLVPGGWSITVEMTFYAVAPWLFRWIKQLDGAVLLVLLSLLGNAALSYWLRQHPGIDTAGEADRNMWSDWLFGYFPNQLAVFGLGLVLFFLTRARVALLRPGTLLASGLGLLATLVVVLTVAGDARHRHWLLLAGGMHVPAHWLFGVGFVLVALAVQRRAYRLLVNAATCYVGRISFSLYLAHFAVFILLNRTGVFNLIPVTGAGTGQANFWFRFGVGLAASVGVAQLSYRWIEVPFQELGKRLIARLETQAPEREAPAR